MAISWLGANHANTNFVEHWSKSPGDDRAVARSARRRPSETALRPLSARLGSRRACDGSTKFRGWQGFGPALNVLLPLRQNFVVGRGSTQHILGAASICLREVWYNLGYGY